jgi:predicted transglutaminase-like cysteine proteinase
MVFVRVFAVTLCLVATPALAAEQVAMARTGLFGSIEIRGVSLNVLPKWTGVLARYFDEKKLADAPCTASAFNRCHLAEWSKFIESIRGLDRSRQVAEVNRYMNQKRYVIDPVNYGVADYWATPLQFLTKNGDCEDYAIAKFFSLRALGFDNDALRILVVDDLNLKVAHAVLVVYLNGVPSLLDNQVAQVVRVEAVRHYRPIYSANENDWWFHRMTAGG